MPLCKNRSERGVKMHKAPRKIDRLKIWHQYLLENDFRRNFPNNIFICDVHFGTQVKSDGTPVPEKDPSVPRSVWLQVSTQRSFKT